MNDLSDRSTPIYVTSAKVSCKTRHQDNRHERIVTIPKTNLNSSYAGALVARSKVGDELYKMGFNSHYSIIMWCFADS